MPDYEATIEFNNIVKMIWARLKPLGYKKQHNNFRLRSDEKSIIINVQKSMSCSKKNIKFTVNFGISFCSEIQDGFREYDCYYSSRLGDFFEPYGDKWFYINHKVDIIELQAEMNRCMDALMACLEEINSESDVKKHINIVNEKRADFHMKNPNIGKTLWQHELDMMSAHLD